MITPVWYRGETREYVVTVLSGGEEQDLTQVAGIELQLKSAPGAVDPPLATLALGAGITLRTQSGETLGQAAVVLPYDWLTQVAGSPATAVTPAGDYYFDVVVIFPGPVRRYVVRPTKVVVRDVVNQP